MVYFMLGVIITTVSLQLFLTVFLAIVTAHREGDAYLYVPLLFAYGANIYLIVTAIQRLIYYAIPLLQNLL